MKRRNALLSPYPVSRFMAGLLSVGLLVAFAGCEPAAEAELDVIEGRMAVVPFAADAASADVVVAFEEAAAAAAAGVEGAELVRLSESDDVDVDASIREIAEETGAAMVLRGSVSTAGDEIELSAEIVDPTDETRMHVLLPERAPLTDPSAAVERLAARVGGALAMHLDPEITAPWHYGVATLESYRISARASSIFAENRQAESLPLLNEAYALDSMNFRPLLTAAAVHRNAGRASVGDSILDHLEARSQHLTELERLNVRWYRGNPEEAFAAAKQAAEIDPYGWTYGVGLMANRAGRFAEAAEWLSQRQQLVDAGITWAQTWPAFRGQYMTALHAIGDHETELAVAQLARSNYPDNPWWIWSEMKARAAMGQVDVVRAQYDTTVMLLETHENASHWENLEDVAVELMEHGHEEAGLALQELVVEHYREAGNIPQLVDAMGFAGRIQEAYETLPGPAEDVTSPDLIGWYGAAAAISGDSEVAREALAWLESLPTAGAGNNLRYQAAIQGALGDCDRAVELYRQATDAGFTYNQAWGGEWWHRDWETRPVRENCAGFQSLLDKG